MADRFRLKGQKVELGDIFLDPTAGITIADVIIGNPDSFVQGNYPEDQQDPFEYEISGAFQGQVLFQKYRSGLA